MKKHLKIQTFIQGLSDQQQKQNYRQYRILQEKKKSQHLNQKAQKDERMEKYIPGKPNSAKRQLACSHICSSLRCPAVYHTATIPRFPCPLVLCCFGQCEAWQDKRVERMGGELFLTCALAAFSSRQLPLESPSLCFHLLMGSSCCDLATALIEPASGLQSTCSSPCPSSPGDANTFLLLLP